MFPSPNIPQSLEEALHSKHPRAALQHLVSVWMEWGAERGELLPALESFQNQLSASGRSDEADLIAEIMEGFDGWCVVGGGD